MNAHCWVAFFVATVLSPTTGWATAQIADKIIIEGEIQRLHTNPLEPYFTQGHERPMAFMRGMMSTACRRGYVATWEIRQGRLYLNKLERECPIETTEGRRKTEWREMPLTSIFAESTGPVHADWYSGMLSIPQGERLKYVHMGYASLYEKELTFKISKGTVRGARETDYRRLLPALHALEQEWTTDSIEIELVRNQGYPHVAVMGRVASREELQDLKSTVNAHVSNAKILVTIQPE